MAVGDAVVVYVGIAVAVNVRVATETTCVAVEGIAVGDAVGKRGSSVMVGTGEDNEDCSVPTRSAEMPVAGMSVIS